MRADRWVMPLYIGVVAGMSAHGLSDPKFWILIVVGNLCRFADRAK